MEFKGTKGEWNLVMTNEVESHLDIAINSDKDDCIAWVYSSSDYKDINGNANAKLIAAAPELLEALQDCLESLEVYVKDGFIMSNTISENKARKAIKKALGE